MTAVNTGFPIMHAFTAGWNAFEGVNPSRKLKQPQHLPVCPFPSNSDEEKEYNRGYNFSYQSNLRRLNRRLNAANV